MTTLFCWPLNILGLTEIVFFNLLLAIPGIIPRTRHARSPYDAA